MKFHLEKCQVIRICTNKRFQQSTTYTIHGHVLAVDSAKYLGVTISEDLQWKTHIDNITAKASRTVGFLRRNLYNCMKDVREATYRSIVRTTLEYASASWDRYPCLDIFSLIYHCSFLSPSLWETARYRLKYCLKWPLNPEQPTKPLSWLKVKVTGVK